MLYHFNLQATQLVVGFILLAGHIFGFVSRASLANSLKRFPRSRAAGVVLLTIAGGWSLWLMATMDLGEFTSKRQMLVTIVPVAYFLTLFFVEEFLAVRALGMVALLTACILLDAAFLNDDPARLALVVLAYAWILCGLFMVGKPYLLRDAIDWVTAKAERLKFSLIAGIAYGVLLIAIALVRFG